ncbi:DUF4139 domain-containing protein [Xanthobacteraceae bacterium A53D]
MTFARTIATTALAAALLCTAATGPLLAADAGIRAITLSSGGLAEINRAAAVEGDGVIRLEVPAAQLDDLLKSLVVSDPNGAVGAITLDGPEQAQDTFSRMPFTAEDLASPAGLLGALQGVRVRVASAGRSVEGRALGLSERNAGEGGLTRVVSILTDAGVIEALPLADGASVAILDADMAARVAEAAAAAGRARSDGTRAIEVSVKGQGRRDVGLSYVVAAPVWKTAYRAVDGEGGKLRLQAWAILENATGEDWKNVAVTLATGAPVTLSQQLYQRYWRARPEVPVSVEGVSTPPPVDRPEVAAAMQRLRAPAGGAARAEAAPPPAPASADAQFAAEAPRPQASRAAQEAEAIESETSARYVLPGRVSLAAGRTLSLPIADLGVASERVSLFTPGVAGRHPVAALVVENGSKATLPPGIVTVYDAEAGYVGDARLPSTPAGETRMASFALDRKVEVRTDRKSDNQVLDVKVVDGMITTSLVDRRKTVYAVKGAPDAPRTVVIEHPILPNWTFRSQHLSGETATARRLRAVVPAGGSVDIIAEEEITRARSYRLTSSSDAQLAQWSSSATDPVVKDKLAALGKARRALVEANRTLDDIDTAAARIRTEQERIRSNLAAVPADSTLARSYLERLAAQEKEFAQSETRRAEVRDTVRRLETETNALIRSF